jgi:catechol 2,3-dioxygenase-like lactoylglutathione lyase family enzyme
MFVIQQLSAPEELPPALPLADERSAISGVDHVVIMTRQPEQVKTLYGEKLGIRLALDKRFEKFGSRLIFFRIGGVTVEIAAPLEDGGEQGDLSLETDRLWGIALQVPDIEAARARMAEAGMEVSTVRTGRKPGTRVCSLKDDPLGIPTLIIEPASA